jgi:hypothetical protein
LIRGSDIGRWASASAAASVSSSGVNDSDICLVVPHPTIIAEWRIRGLRCGNRSVARFTEVQVTVWRHACLFDHNSARIDRRIPSCKVERYINIRRDWEYV